MKKIFLALLLLTAFCSVKAQSWPTYTVNYPFGAASYQTPTFAKPLAITVTNSVTYLKVACTDTLKLSATVTGLSIGAILYVELSGSGGARVTSYSTGFTADNATVGSGKTTVQQFIFDGTEFKPTAASVQVN